MDLFPILFSIGQRDRMCMRKISIVACSQVYLLDFVIEFVPRMHMDVIILRDQVTATTVNGCTETALVSILDQLRKFDDQFQYSYEIEHRHIKKYIEEELAKYREYKNKESRKD